MVLGKSRPSRCGRISWPLAVLGTLGLAGTAVMLPKMGPESDDRSAVVSANVSPSGAPTVGPTASPTMSPTMSPTISPTPPDSAVDSHSDTRFHLTDQDGIQGKIEIRTLSDLHEPFSRKTVFYATDRSEVDPKSWTHWARVLMPAGTGCIVSLLLLLGACRSKPRVLWAMGLAISATTTIVFIHHAWIYTAQTIRLAAKDGLIYGARRFEPTEGYPLNLGLAEVSIPKSHQKGMIERPDIFRAELIEDATRHVMIQKIDRASENEFFEQLQFKVGASPAGSAFVFIHGYNVTFDDALLRTAQISHDLKFPGATILYSWPSHGSVLGYTRDETNVSWSSAHLEKFLLDVVDRTGVKELHLVAHSMGNRAMLGALERIALRKPNDQPMFQQVVMAAPDVDAGEFATRYAKVVDSCSRQSTLYTSATDRALLASLKVHGYSRLGLSSEQPQVFDGVETVEVSPIDTSLLGHSYYGNHPLLIEDLRAIVGLSKPASSREWLMRFNDDDQLNAWRFVPKLANQFPTRSTR